MRISDWSSDVCSSDLARATYKALSCHGGGPRLDVRVSNPWLLATALSCNAMYGIMPITVTAVTIAASHESLPSRLANSSASEVALCSRAHRTHRKRVATGNGVSVRLTTGGGRIVKK